MEINKVVKEKIKEIEAKENVKVLFAVESGSRAWGFPSPDSDYDVRFVYVRKLKDYLKLNPVRDVIEWQLDETLDINGWDLQKTLKLVKDSNPTIFEWVNSPIVYYKTPEFNQFKKLIKPYFMSRKGVHHYLHMAERNNKEYLQDDYVKLKKYFYVLRPILAAKWIIDKASNPPMLFDELIESELDESIKPDVYKLLEQKKEASELGKSKRITKLNNYIDEQIKLISNIVNTVPEHKENWDELNKYFYDAIKSR